MSLIAGQSYTRTAFSLNNDQFSVSVRLIQTFRACYNFETNRWISCRQYCVVSAAKNLR